MGSAKIEPVLRYRRATGGERLFAIGESVRSGRHPYNEVSVVDESMSRYHCWVSKLETVGVIEDLGSSNGTYVNGKVIYQPTVLNKGDRVKIGRSVFEFGAAA